MLRGIGRVGRNRRDVGNLQTGAAENFLLHRGVRREGDVVLIAALRILSFARHDSHNPEGKILHSNCLTDGIGAGKQVVGNRLAHDQHARGGAHIGISKERAGLNRPLAHFGIFLADALNRSVPVHIAGHELAAGVNRRGQHRNGGHFAFNGFKIIDSQSVGARIAGTAAHAANVLSARRYEEQIRANAVDLRLHRRLRTLADTHHCYHGRDTDNDAEHCERRAHLVALQSAKSNSNDI